MGTYEKNHNLVILVPPSRYSRDSGNDDLGDTGIQYNMPATADSLRRHSRESGNPVRHVRRQPTPY